jgi:beta-alanine degradation protein BauB
MWDSGLVTTMRTPATATVQIDNERVIVTEWRLAPGTQTGHHRHGLEYVVVPIVGGVLTIESATGSTPVPIVAGQSYTRPAGVEHNVANDTDAEIVFVEIELR